MLSTSESTSAFQPHVGGYFSPNAVNPNAYLGMNVKHSNLSSLMAMQQQGGYVPQPMQSQPMQSQLAMFHQQLKDRYVSQYQQQTSQGQEDSSAI